MDTLQRNIIRSRAHVSLQKRIIILHGGFTEPGEISRNYSEMLAFEIFCNAPEQRGCTSDQRINRWTAHAEQQERINSQNDGRYRGHLPSLTAINFQFNLAKEIKQSREGRWQFNRPTTITCTTCDYVVEKDGHMPRVFKHVLAMLNPHVRLRFLETGMCHTCYAEVYKPPSEARRAPPTVDKVKLGRPTAKGE